MNMGFCKRCGALANAGFIFCKNCGATLQPPVALTPSDSEASITGGSSKAKRITRRILEIITAAAFLVTVLYWPTTNTGRVYELAAVVVGLVGLKLLGKWPSLTRSKYNWLLFPIAFIVAYEAITWSIWVPLEVMANKAKTGVSFTPYWLLEVFRFAASRILGIVPLSYLCLDLAPPVRRWKAVLLGALTALATSLIDRFWWDQVQHVSHFVALFGIPMAQGA
jgi:hypothetical protein